MLSGLQRKREREREASEWRLRIVVEKCHLKNKKNTPRSVINGRAY